MAKKKDDGIGLVFLIIGGVFIAGYFAIKWLCIGISKFVVLVITFSKKTGECITKARVQKQLKATKANQEKQIQESRVAAELALVEQDQVQKTSDLCCTLAQLNASCDFDKGIKDKYEYQLNYKNKQKFDAVDFNYSLIDTLSVNGMFFKNVLLRANSNLKLWEDYLSKFKELEVYSEISLVKDMSVENYNLYEKKLYEELKETQPTISISIYFLATYASPSGRNLYESNKLFTQEEIISTLSKIERTIAYEQFTSKEKQEAKDCKLQKAIKLRELDKLEAKLIKKEEEIQNKTQEFLLATQDHIYSVAEDILHEETEWTKLKKLKIAFDDGKITFEEYDAKRKALI